MKSSHLAVIALVFVLGVVAAIYTKNFQSLEKDVKAQYLQGGAIELSNEGEAFSLSSFSGQPVVLYFGFTFCPDVCPVGLATIRDALNSAPELSEVRSIFITLDPERDTKQRLEEYTAFFHPNIKALTGSLNEIEQVAKRYGTYFKKSPKKGGSSEEYLVDHTAYFYLIDSSGELVRVLDHNASAQEISDLLLKMI